MIQTISKTTYTKVKQTAGMQRNGYHLMNSGPASKRPRTSLLGPANNKNSAAQNDPDPFGDDDWTNDELAELEFVATQVEKGNNLNNSCYVTGNQNNCEDTDNLSILRMELDQKSGETKILRDKITDLEKLLCNERKLKQDIQDSKSAETAQLNSRFEKTVDSFKGQLQFKQKELTEAQSVINNLELKNASLKQKLDEKKLSGKFTDQLPSTSSVKIKLVKPESPKISSKKSNKSASDLASSEKKKSIPPQSSNSTAKGKPKRNLRALKVSHGALTGQRSEKYLKDPYSSFIECCKTVLMLPKVSPCLHYLLNFDTIHSNIGNSMHSLSERDVAVNTLLTAMSSLCDDTNISRYGMISIKVLSDLLQNSVNFGKCLLNGRASLIWKLFSNMLLGNIATDNVMDCVIRLAKHANCENEYKQLLQFQIDNSKRLVLSPNIVTKTLYIEFLYLLTRDTASLKAIMSNDQLSILSMIENECHCTHGIANEPNILHFLEKSIKLCTQLASHHIKILIDNKKLTDVYLTTNLILYSLLLSWEVQCTDFKKRLILEAVFLFCITMGVDEYISGTMITQQHPIMIRKLKRFVDTHQNEVAGKWWEVLATSLENEVRLALKSGHQDSSESMDA